MIRYLSNGIVLIWLNASSRQIGELPQRRELRFPDIRTKQRPALREFEMRSGLRHLLPIIRKSLRGAVEIAASRRHGDLPQGQHQTAHRAARPPRTLVSECGENFSPNSRHSLPTASTVSAITSPLRAGIAVSRTLTKAVIPSNSACTVLRVVGSLASPTERESGAATKIFLQNLRGLRRRRRGKLPHGGHQSALPELSLAEDGGVFGGALTTATSAGRSTRSPSI